MRDDLTHRTLCLDCGVAYQTDGGPHDEATIGERMSPAFLAALHEVAHRAGLEAEEVVTLAVLSFVGDDAGRLAGVRLRRRLEGERDEDEAPPPIGGTIVPFRP